MTDSIIEIKGLSKQFSSGMPFALKGVEDSLPRGELIGVIGPDGAGKTTLIRLIAGLLMPTEGTITVEGKDTVKDAEFIHYLAGYMPQKFGLYEDLTVMQNLNLYAQLRNVHGKEKEESFKKLLAFTELKEFTDRLARNLSGGMKQKLGLACALIKTPDLLLLDEPSVGVDPISRRELWKMVELLVDEGITVLWSTSYLDEAEKCSRVLLLNNGELLYSGDPTDLTKKLEGRAFVVPHVEGDRRKLLFELLKQEEVMDGVVRGNTIRLLLKEGVSKLPNLTLTQVEPRFEDAFVDMLGQIPKEESKLAARTDNIASDGKDVIVAENLTKKFGNYTAVDHISLSVSKGEIFGLLGPNGAGKTTTFKMLCGLLHPTSGKALVTGLDLEKAPAEARMHIGYMAQKFSLYGNLSVKQNLEFFAGNYQLQNAEKKRAIEEMIDIFNLSPFLSTPSEKLPLGYKQRLSLACANMHRPKILFLDEPTSGVDPITRREFWNHINGLVRKGVTIMITTHFMEEAEYCDRIALIYQGKMIEIASPDELKEKSKTEENRDPTLEDSFIAMIENFGQG